MDILDLPNEMLLAIFEKLKSIHVLYSLVDINKRLDQLTLDPLYTRHLDFTEKSSTGDVCPMVDSVLDRICEKILPRIQCNVNKLTLEPLSMERVLFAANYPELHSLSLVNFQHEKLLQYLRGIQLNLFQFTPKETEVLSHENNNAFHILLLGNTILARFVAQQIAHFHLKMDQETAAEMPNNSRSNVFSLILSLGRCLTNLTFHQQTMNEDLYRSISSLPSTNCVSSTLTNLDIYVHTLDDCLYLLDGRLDCLSTLAVRIEEILDLNSNLDHTVSEFDNSKKLPKLKCFSLYSYKKTLFYDRRIVPLLRRMSGLQELGLFLCVRRLNLPFIDGTHLRDEIIGHMPRLNKFNFSIYTEVYLTDVTMNFPSSDDIQRTFIERQNRQVDCYVDRSLFKEKGGCHIYSLPYTFNTFLRLSNYFQGGVFDDVCHLVVTDTAHPFEQEFWERLPRHFPFLKTLIVVNCLPQNKKQHSSKDRQSSTIITFAHLTNLYLELAHVDYVEKFLFDWKTCLPRLAELRVGYEPLLMVTNNFTSDAARVNCAKLKRLVFHELIVRPRNFHLHFPLL